MPSGKACKHCKVWKPLEEYHAHPETKDRKQVWCKACVKERVYQWRAENRDRYNAISKKQRATAKAKRKRGLAT